MNSGKSKKRDWQAYIFILPGFAIYVAFVLLPIVETFRFSFYKWSGFGTPSFIGLSNYSRLFLNDDVLRIAVRNNMVLILFYVFFPIALALFLTALMTRRTLKGLSIYRVGLFMPYVMSMVVVGVVWRWIYNPAFGPLNEALRAVGLESWALPWLGDFTFALPAVGIMGTWVQYGFCMVLFIAGVQNIDEHLYDAAQIDGANSFRQFLHITLPGLREQISFALVTTLIVALRVFDLVFVATKGGPANRTMVVSLHIYRNAFAQSRVGYAAAIATVLTATILALSFGILAWRQRRNDGV